MTTVAVSKEAISLAQVPHLLVLNGPQRNLHIGLDFARIENRPLLLGRQGEQVDVILRSFQGSISRRHTFISYRSDDKLVIATDAGSSNGTFLNGTRMAGPTPLLPGDILRIGDIELLFIVPIANMSVPARPPQKPVLL